MDWSYSKRNCLLHNATEGQMTEGKGVGRRRTQILDDLRNRRKFREEGRSAFKILTGTPIGKRPLGRPRRRWEDNIRMDLKEVGIR